MADDAVLRDRDADALARRIIDRTGGQIRLALPLGLGKANGIVNALTRAACEDPSVSMVILTALTLQRPKAKSELERRFLEPAGDRLFGRYEPLLYARMIEEGTLPANIEVREFFFQAGRWLGNSYAQRHYISANYTHAFDYLIDFRPNVVAQLVARAADGSLSLSCNTDITVDLLKARREGRADFCLAVEVNEGLPFMPGPALIPAGEVDMVYEPETSFEPFSVVRRPVSLEDMAIGLHVSQLVPDGGTLQIGIGSIGDAIAEALLLRHRENASYLPLVQASPFAQAGPNSHHAPFEVGLYAVTEMLVGGILELFEAGIIRREVDGAAIHAGFFLECRDFYRKLRDMPADQRARIAMMPVSFTNSLYGDEQAKRAARRDARFVNNAMIVTCLGAVVSDGIEGGQVVSGVGGQFNFVEQAAALEGGRSIMTLHATRSSGGRTVSNIRWAYPHETVPRHFRDIVVTEYGVADLRGKTDEQCIAAMIGIADSRFQKELVGSARKAGKIAPDFEIPADARNNTPERLGRWLKPARRDGVLKAFPFGTDFNETEQRLLPALALLKNASASWSSLVRLAARGLTAPADAACLERLGIRECSTLTERVYRLLVSGAIAESAADTA
ncbi:acetyl-CoA hydrolase/transferase C-terminal domain-containing protein [Hoeflea olei]|uniref:acetyl-CoA hydrolase/transferase C-terminal domain-containing protein n=1 Tax=Hoeflea olei TaxID=1480615 RepID=UPI000B195D23|nr:acetyl-CoA hydrolase/transferase C-terminal domain-containing protein [Hoeflea olei]